MKLPHDLKVQSAALPSALSRSSPPDKSAIMIGSSSSRTIGPWTSPGKARRTPPLSQA